MDRIELVVVVACCFGCGNVFQSKFDIRPRLNNTTFLMNIYVLLYEANPLSFSHRNNTLHETFFSISVSKDVLDFLQTYFKTIISMFGFAFN